MRAFTNARSENTLDEVWCVEHPCVYTVGKTSRTPSPTHIASTLVIPTDRGGDLTYHAPGQIVIYPLVNLPRRHLFVKAFVTIIENTVINTLAEFGISSFALSHAPGIYVQRSGGIGDFSGIAKIASLGLKISRGCSYHGLSLNVDMDLSGFDKISPCGYANLRMTSMRQEGILTNIDVVEKKLINNFLELLP